MAQKLQIDVELGVSGFNASLKDATAATTSLSDNAVDSAKKVEQAYQEVGKSQKAAFASSETSKALEAQSKSLDDLRQELSALSKEEVKLLSLGKQSTESYKKNREASSLARAELNKLNTAAQGQVAVTKKTEGASKKLTTQLRELKEELSNLETAGKANSKEFEKIAVSAAKLEDQIGDTTERVKVLSSDTFAFDAAIDSVNVLAGGFAVVQGAVGLFAEDNEELQRSIAKTNSAMAILNGLQQVQKFYLGQSAGKLAILSAAQASYNFIVGASTGLLKLFRIALAATGVGLLVIGILALYEAFQLTQAAIKRNTKLFDDLNNSTTALRNNTIELNKSLIDSNEELAVALGNLTQAEADRRAATRGAFEEGLKENGQAIINISAAIQREKYLSSEIIKAKRETDAAQQELDGKSSLQNSAVFAKKLQDEKDLEAELAKLTTQRVKLQSEVRKNILARRTALNNEIKIIDIDEAKSNKDKNDNILKEEQDANLKRKLEYQRFLRENRILQNEFNAKRQAEQAEAYKKEGGLRSIFGLSKIDQRSNVEILNQRATFLKKEEAIGQGGLENRINIINTIRDANIAAIREQISEEIGFKEDANNQIAILNAQATEDVKAEYLARADFIINTGNAIAGQLSELNSISQEFTQRRIDSINQIAAAELSAINNSLDTERNKQRQIEALNLRTNRKILAEKRKQAQQDKALAIFQTTVNGAAAVVGFLKNPGGYAGIALAVFAGITTAAQIAAISSRPLPKFAKGGEVKGRLHSQGGIPIEAEGGEYIINRQRTKRFYQDAKALNSGDYLSHIERAYVRPAVMDAILTVKKEDQRVSVNARLDSRKMENEIQLLRRDSNKSNKIIAKALNSRGGSSSRYSWN